MKYKSIVISGPVASGTTTAAKNLSKILNIPYIGAGDFIRKYTLKNNIPLYAKEQIPDKVEIALDEKITALAKKGAVIDSHYAGYFNRNYKKILKVLLIADEKTRIKRALKRVHTHKETAEEIVKREDAHQKKFEQLYAKENYLDPKFFDLIIDTVLNTEEETKNKILNKFRQIT